MLSIKGKLQVIKLIAKLYPEYMDVPARDVIGKMEKWLENVKAYLDDELPQRYSLELDSSELILTEAWTLGTIQGAETGEPGDD